MKFLPQKNELIVHKLILQKSKIHFGVSSKSSCIFQKNQCKIRTKQVPAKLPIAMILGASKTLMTTE